MVCHPFSPPLKLYILFLFLFIFLIHTLFKKIFYLTALGLSCSMQALYLCFLICGKWDLVPWPEIEPWPPVFGTQSLTHWTTREVPSHIVLIPGYNELYWIFSLVKMLTSQHSHRTCSVGRWSSSSVLFGHLKTSCRKGLPAVTVVLLLCQDSVNCWETKNLLMHWLGTGCLEIRLQL